VSFPTLTTDASYVAWLARCYCMNDMYVQNGYLSHSVRIVHWCIRITAVTCDSNRFVFGRCILYSAKAFYVGKNWQLGKRDSGPGQGKALNIHIKIYIFIPRLLSQSSSSSNTKASPQMPSSVNYSAKVDVLTLGDEFS
jgi:hypothetical protein